MTTTQTVSSCHDACTKDFASLIEESYSKVYKMAYRLSGNRQDAEDLTQEACYRAFRSFDDFEGDRPFVNWIFRIVTRLYLDLRRSRSRRVVEVSLEAPIGNFADRDLHREPIDARANPEEQLLNGILSEELQAVLEGLSREQLELVRMADLTDMHKSEIASKLNTEDGTVRSRLHRAHKQLRRQLQKNSQSETGGDPQPIRKATLTPVRRIDRSASGSSWMTTSFVQLVKAYG